MALWFVLGLMTVAAAFAVLWPLGRGTPPAELGSNELEVYRDQLAEIDRDASLGLIASADADAARIEISRRLIAASEAGRPVMTMPRANVRRAIAVVALVALPGLSAALYLLLGTPTLRDFPLASRQQNDVATAPLDRLVAQVEAHLEKNPADARGWEVLAPVLIKLGRFDDAAKAYRNIITYRGESADRRADLGEALAAAAGGVVNAEAKQEFERATALDSNDAKARYFLGIAAHQDGRTGDARKIWQAMLDNAPADAPWRQAVVAAIAQTSTDTKNGAAADVPGPTPEDVAAAKDMNQGDRNAMVRGMVDRLAARLKQDGSDVQGWLRLVRAYMVLGESETVQKTIIDARRAVASDADRLRELNDGVKQLGIGG